MCSLLKGYNEIQGKNKKPGYWLLATGQKPAARSGIYALTV